MRLPHRVRRPWRLRRCCARAASLRRLRACAPQQPPTAPAAARSARLVEYSALASVAALAVAGAPPPALHASLLALEGAYLTLHVWPLAPLLRPPAVRSADSNFMTAYTTPGFFASELCLFALLWAAAPAVRAHVPAVAVATHAAFHAVYTAVSAASPAWAVQQNVSRVGAPRDSALQRAWDGALNALNAADAGMHAWYAAALAAALPPGVAATAALLGMVGMRTVLARNLRPVDPPAGGADLRGRVAVVTGAAGGIGRAVAVALAARGARVLLLARDAPGADAAASEAAAAAAAADSGGSAVGIAADLSSLAAARAAADAVAACEPVVHLLVCAAATARWGGPACRTNEGHEARACSCACTLAPLPDDPALAHSCTWA